MRRKEDMEQLDEAYEADMERVEKSFKADMARIDIALIEGHLEYLISLYK